MGLELAKAYIRVQADASRLESDFSNIRASTQKHLEGVKRSALAVMGVFTGGLAGVLRAGLRSAGDFEQTTIAFETMLGSAKETEETLNRLTIFAAKTPFEMPEITQAARGLIQFGERGDELMKTLNTLGNAASGTSTPFSFLALVFNQVRGVGKLLTQDFRQLSTRGILSMQDIADHFGVSLSQAEKKISSGQVKFEDLRKIMEKLSAPGGRFADLMEKQSRSLVGVTSTLNDAWNILFRTLAQSLVPMVKSFSSIMIGLVEAIQEIVTATGGFASAALAGATGAATLGTAILGIGVAARFAGISVRAAFVGTGVGVLFVLLGAALGVIIDKFNIIQGVADSTAGAISLIKDAGLNMWDWIMVIYENWDKIWLKFPDIVKVGLSYMVDMIFNSGPVLAQTLGYALRMMIDVGYKFVTDLMNMFKSAFTTIAALIKAFITGEIDMDLAGIVMQGMQSAIKARDAYAKGVMGEAPNAADIFNKSARTEKLIKDNELDKLFGDLQVKKRERETAREGKASVAAPPPKESPATARTLLEQGRYEIPGLASKIQDSFLKKDDGMKLSSEHKSLLEMGLSKQDDLIKAVREGQGDQPAVLTGGNN